MTEKLSPLLKRLKQENRELRDKAAVLKQKLDSVEKINHKKVSFDSILYVSYYLLSNSQISYILWSGDHHDSIN